MKRPDPNSLPLPPSGSTAATAVAWTGHHYRQLSNATSLVSFGLRLLPGQDTDLVRALRKTVFAGLIPAEAALLYSSLAHRLQMCEPCVDDMPLDGLGQAAEHARELQLFHWMWESPAGLAAVCGITAVDLAVAVAARARRWRRKTLAFDAAMLAVRMYQSRVNDLHDRLQPWCPQCHDDDGKEDQELPGPASGSSAG